MQTLADLGPLVVALLVVAAGLAGWVDAVSGGGGLVQLPSLLLALPEAPPATALGTNKLASVWGTATAAVTYRRAAVTDVATALPMALAALIGAALGALTATQLPAGVLRPAALVLLIVVGAVTLLRPAMGEGQDLRWHGTSRHSRHRAAAVGMGAVIGWYDGVFGPGTGTFLVFGLVALLGYSFLNASAIAKVVNVATNLAALVVSAAGGHVLWAVGLLMGAANVAGAFVGARAAVRRGSASVRVVFLAVVAVLLVSLGVQQWR